jgi:hypothetical protein
MKKAFESFEFYNTQKDKERILEILNANSEEISKVAREMLYEVLDEDEVDELGEFNFQNLELFKVDHLDKLFYYLSSINMPDEALAQIYVLEEADLDSEDFDLDPTFFKTIKIDSTAFGIDTDLWIGIVLI